MKKVIIFRNELLPCSETFILEQMRALTNWHPILTGYSPMTHGLDITAADVRILPGLTGRPWQRRWLHFCQYLNIAHGPTVRALRSISGNLIHAHFGTDAVDIWPSARSLGLPMLVTLHGYDINTYREYWKAGLGGPRRRLYPRHLLRMANHPKVQFIAVSHAIKKRAIEYGIPPHKITVCYIGVDTNKYCPSGLPITSRPQNVIFVGRMVKNKGPLLLIEAFGHVCTKLPRATLTMIGDGPLLDQAKQLAVTLKVPATFLGTCTPEEVLTHIRQARILCLATQMSDTGANEGLGLVMLEAQSCGLPVIGTGLGGTKEAYRDGVTGTTFRSGSPTDLANSITRLLADDELLKKMSENARAFVLKEFNLSIHSRDLECMYYHISANPCMK